MRFEDWFQYYQEIRQQFGYSTEKDQQEPRILTSMIKRKALDIKVLQRKIAGKQIIVIGAGPSLERNVRYLKQREYRKYVKLVADGAVQGLIENKL